jgi:hypothetical protein
MCTRIGQQKIGLAVSTTTPMAATKWFTKVIFIKPNGTQVQYLAVILLGKALEPVINP